MHVIIYVFIFATGFLDNPSMSSTPPITGTVGFPVDVPLYVVAGCIEVWLLTITQPTRENRHLPLKGSRNVFPVIAGQCHRLDIRLATSMVKDPIGTRLINHYCQILLAVREIIRARMNQGM